MPSFRSSGIFRDSTAEPILTNPAPIHTLGLMEDAEKLFAALEELGEREVRIRYARGVYGDGKRALVEAWLHLKESDRAAAIAEDQFEVARAQSAAANAQGAAAERQAVAAESQADSAARMARESITANSIARRTNVIAMLAIGMSLLSLAVSVTQCSQQ